MADGRLWVTYGRTGGHYRPRDWSALDGPAAPQPDDRVAALRIWAEWLDAAEVGIRLPTPRQLMRTGWCPSIRALVAARDELVGDSRVAFTRGPGGGYFKAR